MPEEGSFEDGAEELLLSTAARTRKRQENPGEYLSWAHEPGSPSERPP